MCLQLEIARSTSDVLKNLFPVDLVVPLCEEGVPKVGGVMNIVYNLSVFQIGFDFVKTTTRDCRTHLTCAAKSINVSYLVHFVLSKYKT